MASAKLPPIAAGQRYGRLIAVDLVTPGKNARWRFRCDCGKDVITQAAAVRSSHTTSCGCRRAEVAAEKARATATHGMSHSPEYQAWRSMIDRCTRIRSVEYARYGERGITVCERWRHSFENFLADMGARPSPLHSLDRYPDNDGNYEPTNCRWATSEQQARNRRTSRTVLYGGRDMPLKEAAELANIKYATVCDRLKDGWDIDRALSTPIDRSRIRTKR